MINQGDVLPINAPPIRRCTPGERVEVEVLSSHFSRRRRDNVELHWLYSGIDALGTLHPALARGRTPIEFSHYHVELAQRVKLVAPPTAMLCTLAVAALTPDGETVASNFIHHHITSGTLPLRDTRDGDRTLVLRQPIDAWAIAEWSGGFSPPDDAQCAGRCFGRGAGFFEWVFADPAFRQIGHARRLRILCEVSARQETEQQTSADRHPTLFELSINGLLAHREILPDHPHDSRGALSYLRGGRGAYGYLMRATIEGTLLSQVAAAADTGELRLRCAVPPDGGPAGGLTVYGADAGRFPLDPTVVIEWVPS